MLLHRDQFAAHLCLQGLADNTVRIYVPLMIRWQDWAVSHDRDPDRPDPLSVRAWATSLPGTASTREQARAMLGHMCRALDTADVSAAIPCPRKPRRAPRGLPADHAAALHAAALTYGQKGLAVLVGLYTAARRSEIASLAWGRIDGTHVTLTRPKTRDLHRVPLHPVLAQVLERRRAPGEVVGVPRTLRRPCRASHHMGVGPGRRRASGDTEGDAASAPTYSADRRERHDGGSAGRAGSRRAHRPRNHFALHGGLGNLIDVAGGSACAEQLYHDRGGDRTDDRAAA